MVRNTKYSSKSDRLLHLPPHFLAAPNPVAMDSHDFQARTSAFLAWLTKVGVVMSPKMRLVDFRSEGRGRGVVAAADFAEDELVFSIPRTAVLNTRTAKLSRGRIFVEDVPNWLSLTAAILAEGPQPDSQWAPYLSILPHSLDTLVFWTETELVELQASAVLKKIGKASAEEMFTKYLAPTDIANYNVNMCHKVASTIMAYAFDIPERDVMDEECGPVPKEAEKLRSDRDESEDLVSDDGDDEKTILAMIPLADMLNADAERNNARLCCDNADLEMRTVKPIKSGEEIFNDYGQLPQSDLLRRYGYITDNYAVYNVVELSTDSLVSLFRLDTAMPIPVAQNLIPLSNEQFDKRLELAERESILEDSYDLTHPEISGSIFPEELLALIYLFLVDSDTLAAIESSQVTLPSRSKMATKLLGSILELALRQRENEYGTSLEEDEILLRAGNLPHRRTMAIKVRLGEKIILREARQEAISFSGNNKRMRIANEPVGGKRKLEHTSQNRKRGRFA